MTYHFTMNGKVYVDVRLAWKDWYDELAKYLRDGEKIYIEIDYYYIMSFSPGELGLHIDLLPRIAFEKEGKRIIVSARNLIFNDPKKLVEMLRNLYEHFAGDLDSEVCLRLDTLRSC